MLEILKKKVKEIPSSPGIYKFYDKDKNVIYFGKSKNLKQRVSSYFYKNHKWEKIKKR